MNYLRSIKGNSVILHIKSNPVLQDTFSFPPPSSSSSSFLFLSDAKGDKNFLDAPDDNPTPLPRGWDRKIDYKTGRPYFEKLA